MAWRCLLCCFSGCRARRRPVLRSRTVPCRCVSRLLPPAGRQYRAIMADKPDKTNKLKARLPRGLADRGGAEIAATRRMLDKIRAVYERYGFEPLETPGPGRFRQFTQFDADTVGSASMAADAEMCMMAADTMEALGIPRGSYVVKVNNRKVLDGVREALGIADDGQWLTVMRAIDKLDRLGIEGVKQLLGDGRKDESGDFTEGAGLKDADIALVVGSVGQGNTPVDPRLRDSKTGQQGREELDEIRRFVAASGYGEDRVKIDPSVVRGLEYYTGPVYEVELLLDTKDEKGRPVRFGSVGGGGRYDGLVSRFRGEVVPATGFSIGVSRLQAALMLLGQLDTRPEFGPVVVTVFDRDRIGDYQTMVANLRNAPLDPAKPDGPRIRAELYLGNPKNMGNQLKYADRRSSPCVIIQGSDEKLRGEVQIKDLIEGARAAAAIASNQEWRETRPAQFAVAEDKLVEAVREVLARHGVKWS